MASFPLIVYNQDGNLELNSDTEQNLSSTKTVIISVIGNMGSGKTTLLNKIFSRNEPVGERGENTTRGINGFSIDQNDYKLVVLDTEGLGEVKTRDAKILLFLATVSDIIIFNFRDYAGQHIAKLKDMLELIEHWRSNSGLVSDCKFIFLQRDKQDNWTPQQNIWMETPELVPFRVFLEKSTFLSVSTNWQREGAFSHVKDKIMEMLSTVEPIPFNAVVTKETVDKLNSNRGLVQYLESSSLTYKAKCENAARKHVQKLLPPIERMNLPLKYADLRENLDKLSNTMYCSLLADKDIRYIQLDTISMVFNEEFQRFAANILVANLNEIIETGLTKHKGNEITFFLEYSTGTYCHPLLIAFLRNNRMLQVVNQREYSTKNENGSSSENIAFAKATQLDEFFMEQKKAILNSQKEIPKFKEEPNKQQYESKKQQAPTWVEPNFDSVASSNRFLDPNSYQIRQHGGGRTKLGKKKATYFDIYDHTGKLVGHTGGRNAHGALQEAETVKGKLVQEYRRQAEQAFAENKQQMRALFEQEANKVTEKNIQIDKEYLDELKLTEEANKQIAQDIDRTTEENALQRRNAIINSCISQVASAAGEAVFNMLLAQAIESFMHEPSYEEQFMKAFQKADKSTLLKNVFASIGHTSASVLLGIIVAMYFTNPIATALAAPLIMKTLEYLLVARKTFKQSAIEFVKSLGFSKGYGYAINQLLRHVANFGYAPQAFGFAYTTASTFIGCMTNRTILKNIEKFVWDKQATLPKFHDHVRVCLNSFTAWSSIFVNISPNYYWRKMDATVDESARSIINICSFGYFGKQGVTSNINSLVNILYLSKLFEAKSFPNVVELRNICCQKWEGKYLVGLLLEGSPHNFQSSIVSLLQFFSVTAENAVDSIIESILLQIIFVIAKLEEKRVELPIDLSLSNILLDVKPMQELKDVCINYNINLQGCTFSENVEFETQCVLVKIGYSGNDFSIDARNGNLFCKMKTPYSHEGLNFVDNSKVLHNVMTQLKSFNESEEVNVDWKVQKRDIARIIRCHDIVEFYFMHLQRMKKQHLSTIEFLQLLQTGITFPPVVRPFIPKIQLKSQLLLERSENTLENIIKGTVVYELNEDEPDTRPIVLAKWEGQIVKVHRFLKKSPYLVAKNQNHWGYLLRDVLVAYLLQHHQHVLQIKDVYFLKQSDHPEEITIQYVYQQYDFPFLKWKDMVAHLVEKAKTTFQQKEQFVLPEYEYMKNALFQLFATLYQLKQENSVNDLPVCGENIVFVIGENPNSFFYYHINGIVYKLPNLGFSLKLLNLGKSTLFIHKQFPQGIKMEITNTDKEVFGVGTPDCMNSSLKAFVSEFIKEIHFFDDIMEGWDSFNPSAWENFTNFSSFEEFKAVSAISETEKEVRLKQKMDFIKFDYFDQINYSLVHALSIILGESIQAVIDVEHDVEVVDEPNWYKEYFKREKYFQNICEIYNKSIVILTAECDECYGAFSNYNDIIWLSFDGINYKILASK